MANELFCMGCMQPISEFSESCYHCGYPSAGQNPSGYLPVRTQLSNRYVVGRALEKRSDAIVYIGYDKTARGTVLIREFYPEGLCDRLSKQVIASGGKESAFADMLEKFRKQARVIARMRDLPAMIPVYDLFEENGTMYTVSDRIEGMPLRRYVQTLGGHMKWEEARPLFVPLISALVSLHAAGLYHLGISPDSIIIDDDHRLRLDGWQLDAVRVEGGPLINKLPVGYAAPEQYQIGRTDITQAADVYAVSATMLYALTGEEPPSAADRLNKTASLLVPSDVAEKWPAYIAPTLCDALHLENTRRIQTAELLRERLTSAPIVEALIEDVPVAGGKAEDVAEDDVMVVTRTGTGAKAAIIVLSVLCAVLIGIVVWLLLMGSLFSGNENESDKDGKTAATETSQTTAATTVPTTTVPTTSPTQALIDPQATPNVIGSMIGDVYNQTLNGGMTVKVVDVAYSATAPKGQIVSQYPDPEVMAEKGTVIEVTISVGPAEAKLIDVEGWYHEHARTLLEALGYKVTEIPVYKTGVDYKTVCEMDPVPDSAVSAGQEIFIYVNYQKEEPTTMPQTSATTD